MQQKLEILKEAWDRGDKIGALRVASKFWDRSDETKVFKRAWDAHSNPALYAQLGKNPADLIAAGVAAMAAKFKLQ